MAEARPLEQREASLDKYADKAESDSDVDDGLVPAIPKQSLFTDDSKYKYLTFRTLSMAILVSMGGICFGYDTGQISGFQEMDNFRYQFGDIREPEPQLSEMRTAIIVAILSIGTLIGALCAGPIANIESIGRKYSICIWCGVLSIGNVFQVAAQYPHWYVMLIGRIIAGLGVGGLSTVVPTYMGEAAPSHVRGAIVSGYQLFITIGILLATLINFGTNELNGSIQWRLPIGLGWLWCVILGVGILMFPETPRHEYRHGKVDSAITSIAKYYGVSERHRVVQKQLADMQDKLRIEREGGGGGILEVFRGPRMKYRIALGMTLQALQQLVGTNFFMYFGTTLFSSVGLENSFITAIILGAVNTVMTFPGLYMVEKFGRRPCLAIGAAWQFMCFMVYASLGWFALGPTAGPESANPENPEDNDQTIGYVMIVFACFFLASFAATWGPMAWAVCSEIYPSRYRSVCVSFCAGANWIFNFYLAFATSFAVGGIGFAYGYTFAAANFVAVLVVYFFLPETSGRSLEEIDTMFILEVKPWKSSKWTPPEGEALITADRLRLTPDGRNVSKSGRSGPPPGTGEALQVENAQSNRV